MSHTGRGSGKNHLYHPSERAEKHMADDGSPMRTAENGTISPRKLIC